MANNNPQLFPLAVSHRRQLQNTGDVIFDGAPPKWGPDTTIIQTSAAKNGPEATIALMVTGETVGPLADGSFHTISEQEAEVYARRMAAALEPVKVWVSVLIPNDGADVYEGVRVQASLSEEDCYRDLAEWLEIEYQSKEQVRAALEAETESLTSHKGFGVRLWKVETQEITR